MQAFGPIDGSAWTLYNEDGTIHAEFKARECLVVGSRTDGDRQASTLPDGQLISVQTDGRVALRPAANNIGDYENQGIEAGVVSYWPGKDGGADNCFRFGLTTLP